MITKKIYTVYDSEHNIVRIFKSYKEAETYRFTYGNHLWTLEQDTYILYNLVYSTLLVKVVWNFLTLNIKIIMKPLTIKKILLYITFFTTVFFMMAIDSLSNEELFFYGMPIAGLILVCCTTINKQDINSMFNI